MPSACDKHSLWRFHTGFLGARISEWLYTVALNWLVLVGTASPLLLATVNICRLLPSLLLTIPAGQLSDRFERRRLNLVINLANAILVLLTGLVFWLKAPFAALATLVVLRAVFTAAEAPVRQAFLCGVLEGPQLKSAVAQNASLMNLGRIVGPTLAGFSLAYFGGVATFLLAAAFSLLFVLALATLKADSPPSPRESTERELSLRGEVAQRPQFARLLLFALPVMFFGFPYTAMLPLFTERALRLGSEQLGALLSISAAGALMASTFLSVRPNAARWKWLRLNTFALGLSLMVFSWSDGFTGAAIALFAVGFFGQAYRSSSRMMIQDIIPRERAGKLLGLALMDRGMIPLGILMVGLVAEALGARIAFSVMGVGCLLTTVLSARRP